jgi:peroxiredoxin
LPAKEALYREFGSQGLEFAAVSIRESASTVAAFRKELGLSYPLLVDADGEVTRSFNAWGHPTTVLIGRDGKIIGRIPGEREWSGEPAKQLGRFLVGKSR